MSGKDKERISPARFIQITSLDVVAGAVASALFATKLIGVNPGFAWWILLPMAVWTVYSLDHLIDGMQLKEKTSNLRHYYHYRYRKVFTILILLFASTGFTIALVYLDRRIFSFGILLGMLTAIYLMAVAFSDRFRRIFFQKEVFIALIYTAGIWGGPVVIGDPPPVPEILIILVFMITAFINTSLLAWFEARFDRMDDAPSIARRLGKNSLSRLLKILLAMNTLILLSMIFIFPGFIMAISVLFLMSALMALLLLFHPVFEKNRRYKAFIEGTFFLPALSLFMRT
ncbi:MAG: hypothetical protein K9G67_01985 [Bacteroidales bacterium]|nr:hypothetical protein [Bacteroidales bacterium]MCF8349542.1 hypothetical protein [Bacteroidales bacterium]MCF8375101.1 hypothetical protein [Bacteroidales bacterium]MCF8400008.1 hypothetical protein [Bacteroidales bacterium]